VSDPHAVGKAVEHWGVIDQLGMLQQLGLAPAPLARAQTRKLTRQRPLHDLRLLS
jgi:hypothetical protein